MWQMWAEPHPRTVPCSREDVPQLWEERPLDRDVSNKEKLFNRTHTITTPSQQTEKTIRWQAIQAAGQRRGKGCGKFFKKGGTPNKHKKGGAPPKKTHLLKLVISEEETVSNSVAISGPTHPPKEKYSPEGPPHPPKRNILFKPIQVSRVQTLSFVMP